MLINMNKFLQRADPVISLMHAQIRSFLTKLPGIFVVIHNRQVCDLQMMVCSLES